VYVAVALILNSTLYLHTVLIGFVLFLKQAANFSLEKINWWVLITETACCEMMYKLKFIYIYRCPRRNVPDFGRVFLMLKYTDITQNTYVQS
jgi:hypothetical protein